MTRTPADPPLTSASRAGAAAGAGGGPPMPVKLAVTAAVIGLMAMMRLGVFGHRVMPIAFGMALVVFMWLRDRRLLWLTAVVFAATTIVKYVWVLPIYNASGAESPFGERMFDMSLVLFDLLLISFVVHVLIGARDALERRNADLSTTNEELAAREEEISRQNEELQSQTEELERQSEELRVTNEELATRERMLETLLDLSRSLHLGLSEDEAVDRICQTLGQLVNGPGTAAAILLRENGNLRVRCHHGFGPAGLESDVIPVGKSFAALIIEQRRTGYLEDIALRPELQIPQSVPGSAPRMISVLATPLVVRGNPIGTLEVYNTQRKTWSDDQLALIESLAAQTSVTLENAALFREVDEGRRRMMTILESVPVGLAVADANLKSIRFNPAGAALLGVPPEANIAEDYARGAWTVFVDGKQIPRDRYPMARAVRGERVYPHEIEVLLPSGKRIQILSSASPFSDAQGRVIGGVTSFADITNLKSLQRELETRRREAEEASVRKTRFLAAASHDIRTPANAISLLAELLKRSADSPSMQAEIPQLADELRQSATALVNLVSNVLDVTRFDTDKLEMHETEFPLSRLLEEEARQVLPLAQAKKLSLDVDGCDPGLWLRADRIKLGRVIGNLLGNAIKFTDTGGIKVRTDRDGDGQGVRIAVTDSGIGISPENQSRIFDEFWQLADGQRSKGSGLGLSISKRLVEAMGGRVNVQSTIGQGSTFRVVLPKDLVVPQADGKSPSAG
jgi:PAS domain S-box-containing protein